MDSMIFVLAIFVSIFLAVFMVVIGTTIRKLREEVNELKEQNHKLRCSEHSLLWQRQNLRNEIKRLVLENGYWGNLKDLMHKDVREAIQSEEYRKMAGANRIEQLYQKVFSNYYNW